MRGVDREFRDVWCERRKGESWASCTCSERKEGEVAYLVLVRFVEEDRVVGLVSG
jgi:hypothetical protein